MANFEYRLTQQEKALVELRAEYEEARDFTAILLDKAKSMGIKALGINKNSKKTQDSPWSKMHGYGIFAKEKTDDGNGWPMVWRLAEDAGIYAGCGNNQQAQIKSDKSAQLIDGIYELKKGIWIKSS
jgi:hypothetical protein